jgi:hypothetical protein
MAKVTLTLVIVLSLAATTASAATKHRRPSNSNPPTNNGAVNGATSNVCQPGQSPCRTHIDSY